MVTHPTASSLEGANFRTKSIGTAPAPSMPIAPTLSIEPIPADVAIAPGRCWLVVRQGDFAWRYPIQLREWEAAWILPKVAGLNWSLNARGVPIDPEPLNSAIEQLINSLGGAQ